MVYGGIIGISWSGSRNEVASPRLAPTSRLHPTTIGGKRVASRGLRAGFFSFKPLFLRGPAATPPTLSTILRRRIPSRTRKRSRNETSARLYPDRAACRHRHHCHPGSDSLPCLRASPRESPANLLP